jgi:hypothetical protein
MDEHIKVLRGKFDAKTHSKTFINYLEVVIHEDGTIEYAIPSHQEKLIAIAMKQLSVSRDELAAMCPPEFYFDFITWLCQITRCLSVWTEGYIGHPSTKQKEALNRLQKQGIYKGAIAI